MTLDSKNLVSQKRILVVEDEKDMARTLEKGLVSNGFNVDLIINGTDARLKDIREYDVVILDWMLPGFDGISVLKYWREQKFTTPVLMLTARDFVKDRVAGLDGGADDYMSKFFGWDELLARLHALIRRTKPANIKKAGHLELNFETQVFSENGVEVALTSTETKILIYFFQHPHTIISASQLTHSIYEQGENPYSNVIARHIKTIRKKLHHDPIETIRNLGYRLKLK
jgi:DNA-binding response OmpR family regulator